LARSSARIRCGGGDIVAGGVIRSLSPCDRSAEADALGDLWIAKTRPLGLVLGRSFLVRRPFPFSSPQWRRSLPQAFSDLTPFGRPPSGGWRS
jgi:hypothetical protein